MTIELLHQKQSPGSVLKNFVKLSAEDQCRTRIQVLFCQFCKIFKNTFFYWTPPVVAFSNFKANGFTEAVIQMYFWITHDLSSNWHFCVYFCYTLSTKNDRNKLLLGQPISLCVNLYRNNHRDRVTSILLSLGSIGLTKVEICLWVVTWPSGWCVTWLFGWGSLILSHHPAKFGVHRPCENGNITYSVCHVTTISKSHVTLLVGSFHPMSPLCYVWGP